MRLARCGVGMESIFETSHCDLLEEQRVRHNLHIICTRGDVGCEDEHDYMIQVSEATRTFTWTFNRDGRRPSRPEWTGKQLGVLDIDAVHVLDMTLLCT